jgi:hypothetical protein
LPFCPECGTEYEKAVVACPRCRALLVPEPPARGGEPVVVHRVPDAVAGALLCGVLEHQGVHSVLRSATVPGYPAVRRDWATSAWGEILVSAADAGEARAIIADYLAALERGGLLPEDEPQD